MPLVRVKTMGMKIGQKDTAKEFTRKFEVVCSAPPDVDTDLDVVLFLKGRGIFIGAPLIGFPQATCTNVDVGIARENIRLGTGLWNWPVEYTFSTQPGKDPQNSKEDDPTKRMPEISIRLLEYKLPATWDSNGDAITNSTGDPVRLDDERSRTLISIDRVLAVLDPDLLQDCRPRTRGGALGPGFLYSRNLNSWKPFGSYSPIFNDYQVDGGKGLIKVMGTGLHFENSLVFASFHAEILVDDDFHRDRPWDVGFREFLDEDDKELQVNPPVQIQDRRSGMYVTQPVPLDGNGQQLPAGKPLVALNFQRFPQKDWATFTALNIP